jgi:hypothetical protein
VKVLNCLWDFISINRNKEPNSLLEFDLVFVILFIPDSNGAVEVQSRSAGLLFIELQVRSKVDKQ